MRLESWSRSDVGLVRKSNQDSLGCFPEAGVFVVADGMGGRAEGEVASRIAVDTVRELLAAPPANRDGGAASHHEPASFWRSLLAWLGPANSTPPAPPVDLRSVVLRANQRVFDEGRSRPETPRGSMGTTIVVLRCGLDQHRAEWAHVGDSRLYRVRDGELTLLTADHTLYGEEFWSESHIPITVPHTNRLVRAVGIEPEIDVTIGSAELQAGDLYLLCSDGVSGMVKPDELRAELLKPTSIADKGAVLMERAMTGGGRDNATALLVQVVGD